MNTSSYSTPTGGPDRSIKTTRVMANGAGDSENPRGLLCSDYVEVSKLVEDLRASVDGALEFRGQQVRDFDTRFALWPGQTDDGRQWDKKLGKGRAFPWDGASDARVFYADGLVAERVRIEMAALRRARVQTTALRTRKAEASDLVTTLLTWLFYVHCHEMMMDEAELVANWRETFGMAVMGVWWEETPRLEEKPITLKQMTDAAKAAFQQTGDEQLLKMVEIILDPAQDEQAVQIIRGMSPIVTVTGARRILRELRAKGESILPGVEIVSSLPCWKALLPWVDVFYPSRTENIKSARFIARRQWLTEAQLRGAAAANGWDHDWLEDVIEHGRGKSFDSEARAQARAVNGKTTIRGSDVARAQWEDPKELEHLYEIVWHYQLGTHEDHLLPCMYLTVYCPARPMNEDGEDQWGEHGPAPDDHGEYPFVAFIRERIAHAMSESRGTAQIAKGWQGEMKVERDQQVNRAGVTTLPPLIVAGQLGKTRLELGPGAQFEEKKQGDIRWLSAPAQASDSVAVVNRVEREADRYFARISEHVPDQAWQLGLEDLAGKFLLEITGSFKLSLKLAQQYLPDIIAQRVAGDPQSVFHLSKEEIRGQFDLRLVFNATDLDFDKAVQKLKAYKELVLAADRIGAVDLPRFLDMAARMLDRDMADQLIHAPEVAAEAQKRMVKQAWTQIVAGVEPDMPPVGGGQDYRLQLQELMQIMQSKENQQKLQQSPAARELFGAYVKHLAFGQQQTENADIGRNGVKAVNYATLGQDEKQGGAPAAAGPARGGAGY